MKNTSTLFTKLFLVLFLSSCQNNTSVIEEAPNATSEVKVENEITPTAKFDENLKSGELFQQYFTSEEQEILLKIKSFYEEGISDGFTFDNKKEAYDYNAGVLRSDLFNKIPHTLTFPYNGKFALSLFEEDVSKLSFITNKCGFQDTETKKIINYYCLSLDKDFFAFLKSAVANSNLMQTFHDEYVVQKTVSNGIKQSMILQASEDLDFADFNHQLFYMLFHIFVNEEQKAMDKIK